MKLKSFVVGAVMAAASFAASADTIISKVQTGSSFNNVKIGTIHITGLSNLTGNVFAADSISFGAFSLTLDSVSFLNSTVGTGNLVDTDASASGFNFLNVHSGYYDVFASGTLAGNGQLTNASVLGASYAVTAVPEPETYGMMLGGLALLGVVARRKAKKAA